MGWRSVPVPKFVTSGWAFEGEAQADTATATRSASERDEAFMQFLPGIAVASPWLLKGWIPSRRRARRASGPNPGVQAARLQARAGGSPAPRFSGSQKQVEYGSCGFLLLGW